MTKMLASVSNLQEAMLMLNTNADIIDLKQPKQGSLGALPVAVVKQIVQRIERQKPVSATIGNLPLQADLICSAVAAMAVTGVDYIKIGLPPDRNQQSVLSKLHSLGSSKQLIAVLFADTRPDFCIIDALKRYGFAGVMLDTLDKTAAALPQLMPHNELKKFVTLAHNAELLCGLAGSLKATDIPELLQLEADYLGFRGALCEQHNRIAALNTKSANTVLAYF